METGDEEDYVPESLRGFFEAADKQLQEDLDDVMKFDYSKPKDVPGVNALLDEDDDEALSDDPDTEMLTNMADGNEIFYDILAKEEDEALKRDLMRGLMQDDALKGMPGVIPKDAKKSLWFWQYTQDGVLQYHIKGGGTSLWFHPAITHKDGQMQSLGTTT